MSSELGPALALVKNAYAESHTHMCPASKLVCGNRPERCLLSCLDLLMAHTGFYDSLLRIRACQYMVHSFGLSLSPCVFTKDTEASLAAIALSLKMGMVPWHTSCGHYTNLSSLFQPLVISMGRCSPLTNVQTLVLTKDSSQMG